MIETNAPRTVTEATIGAVASTAGLGAWISTSRQLPSDETPVLIFRNGEIRVGERRWEYPGFEDTYRAFWYWDDPNDDGQAWEDNNDVTHWMPLPEAPNAELRGRAL